MRTEEQKQRQREANRRYDETHREEKRARNKTWRDANKAYVRAYDKTYAREHPDRKEASNAAWRAAHPEKVKAMRAAAVVRGRKELQDHYVRKTLSRGTSIPAHAWPQLLVDLQRENLKLKRGLKK